MSRFDVNPDGMNEGAASEKAVAERLRRLSAEISSLGNALEMDSSATPMVRRAIMASSRSVQELQRKTSSYAHALETIVNAYRRAEQSVQGSRGTPANVKDAVARLRETVDKALSDADIANEKKGSSDESSAYNGDPVNMATGNYACERDFLRLGGLFPMHVALTYNSLDCRDSVPGNGWNHNFDITAVTDSEKTEIRLSDGHSVFFVRSEDGTYVSRRQDVRYEMKKEGSTYTDENGLCYAFDPKGRLLSLVNRSGNSLSFSYDEKKPKLLRKVRSSSGEELRYVYSDGGKLTGIGDSAGRSIRLSYTNGYLSELVNENGQAFHYSYDAKGHLVTVTNPKGVVTLINEYDDRGRVTRQTLPGDSVTRLEYEDAGKAVKYTGPGGEVIRYCHDAGFRNTRIEDDRGAELFEYNQNNRLTSHTDRNGNASRYTYNDAGDMIRYQNACGDTVEMEYNERHLAEKVSISGSEFFRNSYDARGNLTERIDALGRTLKIFYDANGRPCRIIQADKSEIRLRNDDHGNILQIEDPIRGTTRYEYDAAGRITASVTASGNRTAFARDARGNITKVTNALGLCRKYRYDACGKVTRVTDFDGSVSEYTYNEAGKIAGITDPDGGHIACQYNRAWDLTDVTLQNGAGVHMDYDRHHQVIRYTDLAGTETSYEYDANGNRTAVIDAGGNRTEVKFDALNRASGVRTHFGAELSMEYNGFGQISSWRTPDGVQHFAEYDGAGQRTAVRNSNGEEIRYEYGPLGNITAVTESTGRRTEYIYAPGGLLKEIRHPGGVSEHFTYSPEGRVLSVIRDDGPEKHYAYDALGRVASVSTAEGTVRTYTYDPLGQVSSVKDGNGNVTSFTYTGKGKLSSVTDAAGGRAEYIYDAAGYLTALRRYGSTEGEAAHVTRLENDPAGRVIRKTEPDGSTEEYTYDVMGRVAARKDGDGLVTKYAYTAFGGLSGVEYADGRNVSMQYDELRRLSEIRDWLGTITFETDGKGQVQKITDADGQSVSYEAGPLGERLSMTYPDGEKVSYRYDEALRLSEIHAGNETVRYRYDPSGRLTEKSFSGGLTSRYEYDRNGFLKTLVQNDSRGEVNRVGFRYDVMGNRIARDVFRRDMPEENGHFAYLYDELNRLREVRSEGRTLRSYGYDAFGNRSVMTAGDVRTEYEYDAADRLIRSVTGSDITDYRYDRRGNVSRIFRNGELTARYEYDAANRLAQSIEADGTARRISCNGLGIRTGEEQFAGISLTGDTDAWLSHSDPVHRVRYTADMTGKCRNLLQMKTDAQTMQFVWDGRPLLKMASGGTEIYNTDEKGSVLGCLREDGVYSEVHSYDEFGIGGEDENWNQPLGYTGYARDSARTWYAQARQYRPGTGRFDGRDRVNGVLCAPGTLNRYVFCYNSPLIYADADGNLPFLDNVVRSLEEDVNRLASGAGECMDSAVGFIYDAIDSLPRLGEVEEQLSEYLNFEGIFESGFENGKKLYDRLPKNIRDALDQGTHDILHFGRGILERRLPLSEKTISDYMNYLSMSPFGRKVLDRLDFVSDENGVFHTTNDCWQIAGGYNDFYDQIFAGATSSKPQKFSFGDYTIWMWKGDYINLGAGAETGIYKGDGFQLQCATDTGLVMSLQLYDKTTGELIFAYAPGDPDKWWINGFNPRYQDYQVSDLLAVTTIDFSSNPALWQTFLEEYKSGNLKGWSVDAEHMTATYAF